MSSKRRFETFEELIVKDPLIFQVDCTRLHVSMLSVDMACDLIDRCYAEASNPNGDYFIRARHVYRHLMRWLGGRKFFPPISEEQAEVAAYLRSFPLLESVPEEEMFTEDEAYRTYKQGLTDEGR